MKGAFETSVVLLTGMLFLVLGLNLVRLPFAYHQARSYQEIIVNQIERYHRYDETVVSLIKDQQATCPNCDYQIRLADELRYQVKVIFPIKIPIINFEVWGQVVTLTQPLN